MEERKVEFTNPYTRVTLCFPCAEVKKALKFIISKAGVADLDDALVNCWQLSGMFTDEERQMLSMVQMIASGTKDGYVKPEDFDIYALAEEVAQLLM